MNKTEIYNEKDLKLEYIDNLRGIAIIMVIVVHTSQSFTNLYTPLKILAGYGQMGVQLFFVVSAYTLCLSMFKRKSEETRIIKFYLRRFFRIAPLYYCGIFIYLFHNMIHNFGETNVFAPTSQYSLINIISNVFFVHGFYPPANNIIVPGGWSIGTEMAFYIIFPFLFFIYSRFKSNKIIIFLIPLGGFLISSLLIISLSFIFNYELKKNDFIYYNLVCQLPVFLLGMTLFLGLQKAKFNILGLYSSVLAFLFFSFISILIFTIIPQLVLALPFSSGMSFVFLFILFKEIPLLSNKILSKIGQLSFSMYLFHFLYAWDFTKIVKDYLDETFTSDTIFCICLLITLLLTTWTAFLSEKFIEKPGVSFGYYIVKIYNNKFITPVEQKSRV